MLCRIKLCDGQEVYLLHHELAMLQGNYTILQTIAVTSLNQTFVSGFPAVTTPTAFTGAPPPRYDLFALKLLYYANDPQVKSLYKGYNNGNIATMYWQVTLSCPIIFCLERAGRLATLAVVSACPMPEALKGLKGRHTSARGAAPRNVPHPSKP